MQQMYENMSRLLHKSTAQQLDDVATATAALSNQEEGADTKQTKLHKKKIVSRKASILQTAQM